MFRFTIREICLLTVVVALATGWFVDRTSLTRSYTTHLQEVANRYRDADQDASDFAFFGIANGKLLWKNDPPLYNRMARRMGDWKRFRATLENMESFPEDKELTRPEPQ